MSLKTSVRLQWEGGLPKSAPWSAARGHSHFMHYTACGGLGRPLDSLCWRRGWPPRCEPSGET